MIICCQNLRKQKFLKKCRSSIRIQNLLLERGFSKLKASRAKNLDNGVKLFMDDSFASSSISRTELIVMLSDTTDLDDFINGGKDFL